MTMEMKIKMAVERHDNEMKALRKKYNNRFNNISVNSFGEASGDEIMEINTWYDQEKNRIINEFVAKIISA